jgi:hypothetical protein
VAINDSANVNLGFFLNGNVNLGEGLYFREIMQLSNERKQMNFYVNVILLCEMNISKKEPKKK